MGYEPRLDLRTTKYKKSKTITNIVIFFQKYFYKKKYHINAFVLGSIAFTTRFLLPYLLKCIPSIKVNL